MDKITPVVIIALVLGVVIGYAVKSLTAASNPQPSNPEPIAEAQSAPSAEPGSKEAKIQEALSAAPESVTKNAAVMDFPTGGSMDLVELRKGTNDWTCLPDLPTSPGKDPMCVDNKQGMLWMQAYMTKGTPSLTQNGIVYMLAGGSDASNTDPFAEKPTEGSDWITTGPHTMILPAGNLDENVYGTDPKKGGPWIMWSGTPYEHLMIPVK
jgi:hypothetical protein